LTLSAFFTKDFHFLDYPFALSMKYQRYHGTHFHHESSEWKLLSNVTHETEAILLQDSSDFTEKCFLFYRQDGISQPFESLDVGSSLPNCLIQVFMSIDQTVFTRIIFENSSRL
jgi:hypothetical protein